MNIGFDLDGIFINTPQFIPGHIVERLYRDKDGSNPHYRMPGNFEQKIRQMSHHPIFRPAIKDNITYLTQLHATKKHKLFIISSRFGFLQQQTESILRKYHIDSLFDDMYFNYTNIQPHIFKDTTMKTKHIDMLVDDDLSLLQYLAKENPKKKFYWLNAQENRQLGDNLFAITHMQQAVTL